MQHLECLAPQLRLELDDLIALLKLAADCMSDFDFVKQLLHINNDIGEMSADNWDKECQDNPENDRSNKKNDDHKASEENESSVILNNSDNK